MRLYLSILSIFLSTAIFGQIAEFNFDRHSFLIGEQPILELKAQSNNAITPLLDFSKGIPLTNADPNIDDSISLEVISVLADTSSNRLDTFFLHKRFIVTAWEAGKYIIPPLPFLNGDSIFYSMPIEFLVTTVEVDTTKDIKPIKGILEHDKTKKNASSEENSNEDLIIWIVSGVLIVLVLAIVLWLVFRKKKIHFVPPPRLTPHETALARLQELHKELYEGVENKYFYSEVTTTLRIYIEKRYEIPALEKTTNQILKLIRMRHLPSHTYDDLKDLLQMADMVKFAKKKPDLAQKELDFNKAVGFLNITKPFEQSEEL